MSRLSFASLCVGVLALSLTACQARKDRESAEYRAELYDGCAQCHGAEGQGDPLLGCAGDRRARAVVCQISASQVQAWPPRLAP